MDRGPCLLVLLAAPKYIGITIKYCTRGLSEKRGLCAECGYVLRLTAFSSPEPQGWQLPAQSGFASTPAGLKVSVPLCRVEGYSAATSDSRIGFEVWLPAAANWNGMFLAGGNPGFIGSIARSALAGVVQRGYATASTDTGHMDERCGYSVPAPGFQVPLMILCSLCDILMLATREAMG